MGHDEKEQSVPGDDLSSVPGLQEKHRRVLAGELGITTLRALVDADLRDIHQAMRNLRPRPTLEQITRWQEYSRSTLAEAEMDESDWHPAASFAIVFAQRRAGDGWERRLEAERTEVEPQQERSIWPGWASGEILQWMHEQLDLPDSADPRSEASRSGDVATTSAGPTAHVAGAGERVRLRIDSATVIGPTTHVDALAADPAAAALLADLTGPVRLEIAVGGARPGQEIHAVSRILRRGEPGRYPHDPVVIKGPGRASFDLSRLPTGLCDITLVAWAPDGTAIPALASLPGLSIRTAAEPLGHVDADRAS
jgi:hypothetical protein